MNVDEFMKMNASEKSSRFSQLTPFREDILKLKNEGFTERKILEFLALNNVVVNQSTLHRFVKRQTENKPQKRAKKTEVPAAKVESDTEPNKKNPASVSPGAASVVPVEAARKERQLVEFQGRAIDVNYKPSWVPDDINLKDLL